MTRDAVEITLEANLELPLELDQAIANGATGSASCAPSSST